jgi:hypothetical protein
MPDTNGGIMTDLSNLTDGNTTMSWGKPTPLGQQAQNQKSTIFGPGLPVMPVNPLDRPRIFEYRPGVNLVIMPRYGYGLADFQTLRNLAAACKEVRLNIELIKREVRSLEWKIVPSVENDKTDYSRDIAEVQALLESPDGQLDFDGWVNALLEEVLVTDALTIYPNLINGELRSLDLIDGTRIRPVLDYRGKIAAPPAPGYIQVLYGMPQGSWTTDEMIYRPMNASVNSPYGMSPLEFILLMVNMALRRDSFGIATYTEGNLPDALIGAPATWSQPQIDTWQQYWDGMITGDVSKQRKLHWIPTVGAGSPPVYEFKKGSMDTTVMDEWLMKIACWAYGNSPQEFGLVQGGGLGGAGYAGAMADVHQRSMIQPVTQFVARIFTRVIHRYMRKPHLKYQWVGLDPSEDTLKQAQVDQINLDMGVYDVGYIQERDGVPSEHRPDQAPTPPTADLFDTGPESGIAKFFRGEGFETYP